MTTLTETLHAGAFIVSESEGPYHTREAVRYALNQTILSGMVLARLALAASIAVAAAADAGNTAGAGAITMDGSTPTLEGVQNGRYRAVCIEPAANAGTFEVFDPKGNPIGRYNVGGAAFAREIKFTISDATDFAVGDAFNIDITIENTDYDWAALDLTKAGEAAEPGGIAVYPVTTDGTNKKSGAAIVRGPCEVRLSDLTWPAGITADQKAACIRKLEALGIVGR